MPMNIQSTLIKEDGKGSATVEMTIFDVAAQATTHAEHIPATTSELFPLHAEIVTLRMDVLANHNSLPGFQGDAVVKAIAALEAVRAQLEKR